MGTDTSSMKDSTIMSEKTSNIYTTEQKESSNHMSRFIEQNQIKNENEATQDVKVEKEYATISFCFFFYDVLLFLL